MESGESEKRRLKAIDETHRAKNLASALGEKGWECYCPDTKLNFAFRRDAL